MWTRKRTASALTPTSITHRSGPMCCPCASRKTSRAVHQLSAEYQAEGDLKRVALCACVIAPTGEPYSWSLSSMMVTGPSLWISTCIMAPKTPCVTQPRTPARDKQSAKAFTSGSALFGLCGVDIAGASAFAGISVKRELRHDQRAPADIQQRQIHLARHVAEDAQISRLRAPVSRLRQGCPNG